MYSSEHGRVCPHCGLPARRCVCRANPRGDRASQGDGVVRIRREVKGRRYTFAVECWNEDGVKIGDGIHERAVIEVSRFAGQS